MLVIKSIELKPEPTGIVVGAAEGIDVDGATGPEGLGVGGIKVGREVEGVGVGRKVEGLGEGRKVGGCDEQPFCTGST